MSVNDLFEKRKNFYLAPSVATRGATWTFLLAGLLAMGYGFSQGMTSRVWGAFLFNVFFFFSIALGGMAFSAMQDVIGAVWGRPIKRLHEGFGAFVPVAGALFALFLILIALGSGGAGDIYPWIKDPSILDHFHGKNSYLTKNWMLVRSIGAVLIICLLTLWQLRHSLRRDVAFVEGNKEEAAKLGKYYKDASRFWSAPILVGYALCYTSLGFDLLMSLEPLWFSTLWGGWLFAIMMQTLMALLLLFMFTFRESPIGSVIGRQQFHDVGKLMHGFTIFFAYLTYAHVLTYWYGNVPEETEYFLHRLHEPWIYIVLGAPILNFVIPLYVLIFKAAKWTAAVTIPIATIILTAQWFVYMLVVSPAVVEASSFKFPHIELGMFLGVLGLFLHTFYWFGRRYPMVGLGDPLLKDALSGGH